MPKLVIDPLRPVSLPEKHAEYYNCVAKLRHMAGLPIIRAKPIREAIWDNTFPAVMRDALRCHLLEGWPLREQINFLDGLSGLSDVEKSLRIHEAAYGLYRQKRFKVVMD